MRVKVIKDSVIYEGGIYQIDETFDIDDVVGTGLIKSGYVVAEGDNAPDGVAEVDSGVPEEDSQEEQMTGTLSAEDLQGMSYQGLKKLAADLGVGASGTKEELIDKISKVEITVDADDAEEEDAPNTSMPE